MLPGQVTAKGTLSGYMEIMKPAFLCPLLPGQEGDIAFHSALQAKWREGRGEVRGTMMYLGSVLKLEVPRHWALKGRSLFLVTTQRAFEGKEGRLELGCQFTFFCGWIPHILGCQSLALSEPGYKLVIFVT